MRNNLLKYVLILSLLLNASFLGAAGYAHFKQARYQLSGPTNCPAKGDHLFQELSLKPEQIKLFRQKADLFHRVMARKKQEVGQMRGILFTLMRDEHPDQQAIDRTIQQINTRQQEMQKIVMSHLLEFKGLLDQNQQKKFFDLIEKTMIKQKEILCP